LNSVGGIKKYKDITIDTNKMIVKVQEKEIELTNFEYKILDTFISNIGIVFSRSALLSILRGDEGFNISERAVDVQIVNLRRKLGQRGQDIETIRGSGYKLKEIV
jgi:two-component system phosphate regulon response regulator PhoB